jgi:hypothetical protein
MTNRTHLFIVLALLLALGLLGWIMGRQIPPRIDLPFETGSTVLAAEFASMPDEIISVFGVDRRYAKPLQMQQYLDFIFIACYVALFVIIGLALKNYDLPGARWAAWIVIACAVAAGLFDIGENITILRTIANAGATTSPVRWFSVPKWALVFLVMLLESPVFFFWPRLNLWWRLAGIAVGGLFLFTGASGLLFSALVSVSDIAWVAEWMAWAIGASTLFIAALLVRQLRY